MKPGLNRVRGISRFTNSLKTGLNQALPWMKIGCSYGAPPWSMILFQQIDLLLIVIPHRHALAGHAGQASVIFSCFVTPV